MINVQNIPSLMPSIVIILCVLLWERLDAEIVDLSGSMKLCLFGGLFLPLQVPLFHFDWVARVTTTNFVNEILVEVFLVVVNPSPTGIFSRELHIIAVKRTGFDSVTHWLIIVRDSM